MEEIMDTRIQYIDKTGKLRYGKKIQCACCHTEFITRIDQPQKFCSKRCQYKFRTLSNCIQTECAWCHKPIQIKISQHKRCKSGLHFCSSECHGLASRLEGGLTEVMPAQYGNGSGQYTYRKLFTTEEMFCHVPGCGYNRHPSVIVVHHLDGNRKNNVKSNLLPVCCNCHEEIHLGISVIPKPDCYIE